MYIQLVKLNTCKTLSAWYATVRLEAAKDDYRIHCEELEKQLVELQHRNDELTSLAEESRALKDELDILRWGVRVSVCVCVSLFRPREGFGDFLPMF